MQAKKRLWLYGLSAVLVLALFVWSGSQHKEINRTLEADLSVVAEYQNNYADYIAQSSLSSVELAERGMALLKSNQQLELASLLLRVASEKDPQFRDAAIYAGFAELAVADTYWEDNAGEAGRHTQTALRYLEQAQAIDPINAYTYELIALAHANLGETEAASVAQQKAEEFAISS